MTFLKPFLPRRPPRSKARTCEVHQPPSLALTAPLSHVVAQWMIIALSSACARGDSAGGRSSETGAADRVGSLRTLPSEVVVPTGRNWAHMKYKKAPQSPPKTGVVDIARIPKAWPPRFDFGEEGRPSHDFSYFSIPFLPRVFHRRLFKVLRKKNEIHCMGTRSGYSLRIFQFSKGFFRIFLADDVRETRGSDSLHNALRAPF